MFCSHFISIVQNMEFRDARMHAFIGSVNMLEKLKSEDGLPL